MQDAICPTQRRVRIWRAAIIITEQGAAWNPQEGGGKMSVGRYNIFFIWKN